MRLLEWLRDLWAARCRRYDLEILWPACKRASGDSLLDARLAFAMHVLNDPAWRRLDPEAAVDQVMELE